MVANPFPFMGSTVATISQRYVAKEVNIVYNCCTSSCISRKLYLFVRIFTVVDVVNISCI